MSRTRTQLPRWVALLRHGIPSHDHSRGPCDLEEYREYISTHGNDNGPALRPGAHKGCAKVTALLYVTCYHNPALGPKFRGIAVHEDASMTSGGDSVRYYEDRTPHPGKTSQRYFYDCRGETFVKEVDPLLQKIGDIPSCRAPYRYHRSDVIAHYAGGSSGDLTLRSFNGDAVFSIDEDGDYVHHYYVQIYRMAIPCVCDERRWGYRFSCTLELPPDISHLVYRPRHSCGCIECEGNGVGQNRRERRQSRSALDRARHDWNSGYLDEMD